MPAGGGPGLPGPGSERVVEIQFRYSISQETLLQMRRDVQVLLNSAAGYVEGLTSEQVKANRLYAFLRPLFVQSRPSETPVYSLLCVGAGDSRSVAMVYGLLCRRAGAGLPGGFRHQQRPGVVLEHPPARRGVLSCGCADGYGRGTLLARYDEDMEGYVWNTKSCPPCPKPVPLPTEGGDRAGARGDPGQPANGRTQRPGRGSVTAGGDAGRVNKLACTQEASPESADGTCPAGSRKWDCPGNLPVSPLQRGFPGL